MLKIIAHFFSVVNRFLRHIATFLRGREFFSFLYGALSFFVIAKESGRKKEENGGRAGRKKRKDGRGQKQKSK
jgi:hypothetical protein